MAKHEAIYEKNKKLNIKKIILAILIILSIVLAVVVWKFDLIHKAYLFIRPIRIENIEISLDSNELEPGETADINTKITPEDFTKSNLVWHSTDENIIEVVDRKSHS